MASYNETAKQVIELVGGKENVVNAWHCVTRLRFNLANKEKVKLEEIKKIKGVMGAQFSGDQFQVIIGNTVADVFMEVEEVLGGTGSSTASNDGGKKEGIISKLMDGISGIFTPILPALAGAGLLKGFIALFVTLKWLSVKSGTYAILNMIGDGVFYFLPFFLAISTARKVKTNEYVALAIAAPMLYPTLTDAVRGITKVKSFTLFGSDLLTIPVMSYSFSVIPIILGVILLKYVMSFIKSWMPKSMTLMFTPLLSILIVVPITLWIIGPMGMLIGKGLSTGVTLIFDFAGPLAGLLLAGFMPFIIMTGMHYAFMPVVLQNFASLGFDPILSPTMLISNVAQGGAALAVALRTRNKPFKQLATSSAISAMLGITEPAMYGVNMKLKKPLYLAMISSGILGAVAAWFHMKKFVMGGIHGLFILPTYADPSGDPTNLIIAIILFIAAIIIPFVLVMVFGFKDIPSEEEETNTNQNTNIEHAAIQETPVVSSASTKTATVFSPLKGEIVPLKDVADPTFADEIMGKGIAIKPEENRIVSPVSGTVMVLTDTNHAVGLQGDDGQEILIHIGIDTVSLKGKHFRNLISTGDRIEVGQPLIEFDRDAIAKAGFDTVTMVIVTNTADYLDVLSVNQEGSIFEGEQLLSVVK
ncbi:beta-glucoside-specific PTS transporter subunit IIABC [Bacillus mycoides]|uniref:PTS beta-glucoside transporter subunit EIIBCA n=2 Tax=Bacillus cereus group TaxID=86661 RepID=A0A243ASD3_BACTU|nr:MULTISPECIES: beta-glucoside-specific PTS transporter subunit IIABC [Bacillus cereus group]MED1265468.1 beta-glucoside-specific PTS transporter subunit IIABC [Bacillus mycoides]OTY28623.1 hypothetical protein BK732_03045 [Bacillus thuringiensis serovar navarrensis]